MGILERIIQSEAIDDLFASLDLSVRECDFIKKQTMKFGEQIVNNF